MKSKLRKLKNIFHRCIHPTSLRIDDVKSDKSTLKRLVSDTRAVITTAGPFQKYGESKPYLVMVSFCMVSYMMFYYFIKVPLWSNFV